MRGEQRHDHGRNVQLAGDRHHVQRPGAARGDQREVARIVALGDRDLAHRERHLGDRDLDDRLRGRDGVELERLGDLLLDAARGAVGVELHLAAEEIVRIEPAEHHVGVGDGRLGAAAAVADRAGIGARAVRADLERADVVEPGDRAAAGADLDHVDHRQHHRMAAGIAADVVAGRHGRLAVADQARLGGGAAHVERDDVGEAERLPDLRRRDDAADRTGLHHGDRPLGRDLRRHHAAVRAHDREIAAKADVAEARLRGSPRSRRPSGRYRRSPPWSTCARTRDTRAGSRATATGRRRAARPDHLAGDALVLGIDVGVQEAHRDRFDAFRASAPRRPPRRSRGERLDAPRRRRARAPRPRGSAGATPAADGDGRTGCRIPGGCRGR